MFAVIRTGGKQYKVAKNDVISVEKLLGEPGDTIEIGNVLMIGETGKALTVGKPMVDKASVFAEVLEQTKDDKIIVFKKKRRHNYRRKRGHRQELTVLKVLEVSPTGVKPAPATKKAAQKKTDNSEAKPAAAKTKKPSPKEPAKKKAEANEAKAKSIAKKRGRS